MSDDQEVISVTLEGVAHVPKRRQWLLRSFVAKDGEIYVPSAAAEDNETLVFFQVAFDGVGIVRDGGHFYIPLSWVERNYPAMRDFAAQVRAKVARLMDEESFWGSA